MSKCIILLGPGIETVSFSGDCRRMHKIVWITYGACKTGITRLTDGWMCVICTNNVSFLSNL